MTLDQLSAFAITEDHERQKRVWSELPRFNRSRECILHALSEGQLRSDDRRAVFVGAKAYQVAGGTIVRDLFDSEAIRVTELGADRAELKALPDYGCRDAEVYLNRTRR